MDRFGAKGGAAPVLRINDYGTESDVSEHRGFANLLRGIFGTFRNRPAHTPRADEEWTITETDALDLFSMLSYVHRRLDEAQDLTVQDENRSGSRDRVPGGRRSLSR